MQSARIVTLSFILFELSVSVVPSAESRNSCDARLLSKRVMQDI